jgi:hypothetical protein
VRSVLVIVLALSFGAAVLGRTTGEPSYESTRALLRKLKTDPANGALRKLFREAYKRRATLLRALDDPEQDVQVNALLIIDYVALPELTNGFAEWQKMHESSNRDYRRRRIDPLDAQLANRTFSGDPAVVTQRYLFGNQRGSYHVVARNEDTDEVLLEVVFGEALTEGWHVVLRKDGSGWRPILKTNVWVS